MRSATATGTAAAISAVATGATFELVHDISFDRSTIDFASSTSETHDEQKHYTLLDLSPRRPVPRTAFYESDCQGQFSSLLIAFRSSPLQSAPTDRNAAIVRTRG
ncbi:MAG: hypothetical protein M3P06_25745, partial [Acidobacteriota bacterium]|nr:hypothetical protein [Acidobacteriota bacterium]